MINKIFRYAIIYIVLLLLQVLVFNNIQFSGYINPFVYVLFLLLLPVEIAGWLLLIISFFAGFIMDIFTATPGMHAGATLTAGFFRPYLLRAISPRDGYGPEAEPSMAVYGFRWFLVYTLVIVAIHHLFLFYFEVFSLTDLLRTFLRVVLSTVFTVIFIIFAEYFRKGR
ncbi:MAG: rod shape-determining protein MreD [Bacteroidales bacterium]